ncbi:MAG: aldo/keto reductase [Magnetospirillum sp.]|nr:aldo/keto reductase [Magnetospirillum sp.]
MELRDLGRTGLRVSAIGFGAWGIGGLVPGASYGATDDAVSRAALARAFARGIVFFDTAPAYGDGHSESLLGEFLSGLPAGEADRAVVATKAGQVRFADPTDFSPAAIRASVEGSLRRLRRPAIDLLQLHNPTPDLLASRPEIVACLVDLRRAGHIRAWGISTKTPAEALRCLREFDAPVVQANYNLIDHRAADGGLFDEARVRGAGVIARTPLAFGFLTGTVAPDAAFPEGDHRRLWPRERLQSWSRAAREFVGDIAAREGQTLAQIALRFCVSRPEVSTAIPGILTPAEADANATAGMAGPLAAADLARIERDYRASPFA